MILMLAPRRSVRSIRHSCKGRYMIKSIQADVTSRVPKYNAVDRVLIPFIVAISFMMERLDTTIVITALPKMADNFHTTAVSLNIAVTSYLLSLAVFMPMSGWAAERWGKREVYMAALLVLRSDRSCAPVVTAPSASA
ncbi:MFS transporter [Komagataeibacter rhaeticus]|nr:MFS transporter [Komagataeibacter rhaeticus]